MWFCLFCLIVNQKKMDHALNLTLVLQDYKVIPRPKTINDLKRNGGNSSHQFPKHVDR